MFSFVGVLLQFDSLPMPFVSDTLLLTGTLVWPNCTSSIDRPHLANALQNGPLVVGHATKET